jgi:hypothetical protein
MRKRIAMLLLVCLSVQGAGTALAVGLPWQNHASHFNFVFGNPIDMHHQPKQVGNMPLLGFAHASSPSRSSRLSLKLHTLAPLGVLRLGKEDPQSNSPDESAFDWD